MPLHFNVRRTKESTWVYLDNDLTLLMASRGMCTHLKGVADLSGLSFRHRDHLSIIEDTGK